MMKRLNSRLLILFIAIIGSNLILPESLNSHCQIPCGIYDDHARVKTMLEDAATVEKSTRLIIELSGKSDPLSQNQLVRWVMNKEKHAQNIISTISDYFLTQRIKPSQKDYTKRLLKHHAIILAAMEVKQNADMKFVKSLKKSIKAISSYYPAK